ncbi:G-protein coupled receptor 4-like [Thunnus albacares]|uniref:G-protein coupled receptor 4-like n=1 Tax=Thunnus albacares TaxID=8236 RepID=UPI001CF625CE|nr:G-protein coupled receptor 4-like [Thunnus albacares]
MLGGSPLPDEWMQQIWNQFGRVKVDLFANRNNTHCLLWFFLMRQDDPPVEVDTFAHCIVFHSEEEDFYINTSQMESNNISNVTSHYNDHNYTFYNCNYIDYDYNYTYYDYNYTYYDYNYTYYDFCNYYFEDIIFILDVVTYVIISIGLPLTLVAIYSLYSQVKNDHVAPIYIINLLISDIFQLCYMIVKVANTFNREIYRTFYHIYYYSVLASVGFMVCIALERYLLIAWPLWYRVRKTIKISLAVCVVVWILPLVYVLPLYFLVSFEISQTFFAVFLLVPFPLFIFLLGGTLKSLFAAISVSSDEKPRIVGMLVLVLLIYTLLFLPNIIWYLVEEARYNHTFSYLTFMFLRFSPLADLILYFFIRKGAIDKLLASLCCCRMDSDDNSRSSA